MNQDLRIEDLLSELGQEGQLESNGAFTLDAKAAVQKLSKFQLEDPSAYLAKIIQTAVASGATSCKMEIGLFSIECWLAEARFDVAALGTVPGELLKPATATPERYHLAVALNAAISTVIASIELAGFDGSHGQKVVWKSGETQVTEWVPPKNRSKERLLYLKFTRNQNSRFQAIYDVFGTRDVLGMLSGRESGWTRDEQVLHTKFDLAPLSIRVNGREVRWGAKSFSNYSQGPFWSVALTQLFQDRIAEELFFLDEPGTRTSFKVRVQSTKPRQVESISPQNGRDSVTQNFNVVPMVSADRLMEPGAIALGTPVACRLWAGVLPRQKDGLLKKAAGTRLILVDDGFVIFDQTFDKDSPFEVSGSGIVIACATELTKDLSSLQIVDNSVLHDRIRAASQLISHLVVGRPDRAAEIGLKFYKKTGWSA